MNFQDIPTIATAEELIERALRRASKIEEKVKNAEYRARLASVRKIHSVADNLTNPLQSYVKAFPSLDNLHPFEKEIVNLTVGIDRLKKSLGAVDWARKKVLENATNYVPKARARKSSDKTITVLKEAYAKMTNIVRQVDKNLNFLISTRSIFRNLPNVDPEKPIAVFAGSPNVGKSSLIASISTGKPEVKEYPFTTKSVSLGHITSKYKIIQVMDTPGLLDRPDSERNDIEKQGIAALDYLEPLIVFLTDLSGTSGYTIQAQISLRNELRNRYSGHKWVDVYSKSDLDPESAKGYPNSIELSVLEETGIKELKSYLTNTLLR